MLARVDLVVGGARSMPTSQQNSEETLAYPVTVLLHELLLRCRSARIIQEKEVAQIVT
jgi:hypothetical protein